MKTKCLALTGGKNQFEDSKTPPIPKKNKLPVEPVEIIIFPVKTRALPHCCRRCRPDASNAGKTPENFPTTPAAEFDDGELAIGPARLR